MVALGDLTVGDKAEIVGYTNGDASYRHNLLVLGLTPGTQIQVKSIAPLGDPIELLARGASLCLRKSEAHILKLEKITK